MPKAESPIEMARRHVAEADQRVARQKALLDELLRDGHAGRGIAQARSVLEVLEQSLRLAREHLRLEREHYGNPGMEA